MIDFLRWLLVIEILGAAILPLTLWLFRWLPDRGYGFGKILGLLAITYVTWIVGNALPIAGPALLPTVILVVLGVIGWWLSAGSTLAELREMRRTVVVEECLFVGALVVWTLMRAYVFHPGISHTEQYMDLTFLQGSLRSASYPPYDPWMSGHAINYYYFGYLMYAMVIKLSGVLPAVGYNLALSTVFAFTLAGAYSVIYALTRNLAWSGLGPVFVGLLGNWHAALVQLPAGCSSGASFWFWESSRVVGNQFAHCSTTGSSPTINEFPYFSFMLGDLHPHVMALPVTILSVGVAAALLFSPYTISLSRQLPDLARLGVTAIIVGSLYAINSWDFPTYLLVVAACIGINAYLTDSSATWWKGPALTIPLLAVAGVVAFSPFYFRFKAPAHGIGLVTTPTPLFDLVQVFGLFLAAAAILLVVFGLIYQPADEFASGQGEDADDNPSALEVGSARADNYMLLVAGAAFFLIVGIRFHLWTLMILILFLGAAAMLLHRVVNTEEPRREDAAALCLIAIGCLALAFTEVVYLRDAFDGGTDYRMNTVFKFYYQAWTLLGLAGAFGAYRSWRLLRKHFPRAYGGVALAVLAVGVAAAGLYTVEAPQSAALGGNAANLNGMSELIAGHPSDAAAIAWLQSRVKGNPVTLEAVNPKSAYDSAYGRVAAFTGLPTVMGWQDHEYQWRGADAEIGKRFADVTTIYTTKDAGLAARLLHAYHVRYVFAGDSERAMPGADLGKFARFMRVAYQSGSTKVYTW